MIFEKNRCDRCERMCFVCVLKDIRYCDACFDIMINDLETKKLMKTILIQCGIEDLEPTWLESK